MIAQEQGKAEDLKNETGRIALEMENISQETKRMLQQWRNSISALHRKDESLQVSKYMFRRKRASPLPLSGKKHVSEYSI